MNSGLGSMRPLPSCLCMYVQPLTFRQELVVNDKVRPKILPAWEKAAPNGGCDLREMVSTIKDCWDQDAEARLSASNVKERIKVMREQQQQQLNQDAVPAYSAGPNNAVAAAAAAAGESLNDQQVTSD